jgi:RNA polymerase sigma factor (sigma-70 family)
MSFDTREPLLQRLRQPDDKVAWDEFHALYHPLLHNFFLARGLNPEDAGDVSQNVLGRISKAAPDFRYDPSKGKFRSWFFRIARNEFNRFFAKQARRREFETVQETPRDAGQDAELESVWNCEYRQQVFDWACQQVKPHFSNNAWQAFWRTTVDEIPSQQVADELDVKIGTVYISKSRVISRLRERIASISGEQEIVVDE